VEVWDVVDRALNADGSEGGGGGGGEEDEDDDAPAGLSGQAAPPRAAAASADKLDAEHIDVYKGAHAVIALFDLRSKATWEACKAVVKGVPEGVPVLVLGNFKDEAAAGGRAAVSLRDMEKFAEKAGRERAVDGDERRVLALEASMKDCFGLKVLYSYFNLPFLDVKVAALQRQLRETRADVAATHEELSTYVEVAGL
jgi:hypothetical protein